jgi:hypothetical protein
MTTRQEIMVLNYFNGCCILEFLARKREEAEEEI